MSSSQYGCNPQISPLNEHLPYVRVEWTADVGAHWKVFPRMTFHVATDVSPAALHGVVLQTHRPASHQDVVNWLQRIGAVSPAEWRLEVETESPCALPTIAHGFFLHYLLRMLVQYGDPSKPQFVQCFQRHFVRSTIPPNIIHDTFARNLLAQTMRSLGMKVLRRSNYPVQPRPFDCTWRDLPRLIDCHITPKVNEHRRSADRRCRWL